METKISSANRDVIIGAGRPTVLIGERINPTGKKRMQDALKSEDFEIIRREAISQVQAGADLIDVNVATPGVNEISLLPRVVKILQDTVDVPICIDSTNIDAIDAALKVYRGKALVNSVTGEQKSLETVLPLVNKYGTAVIGLVQDEKGVPNDPARRLAIAHKIIGRAEAMGISRQDIIIDCLALTIGAEPNSGLVVFETARLIGIELGVNVVIAVSNISFGLPDRVLINNAFTSIIIGSGINCIIADVAKVRSVVVASDLILGRDQYARRYINAYRERRLPQ